MLRLLPASLLLCALLILGCEPPEDPAEALEQEASIDRPAVNDAADSLAMRTYEAIGGPEAWQRLPGLRFDFAIERGGERTLVAKHLWNRETGDYRLERTTEDGMEVILFNVDTQEGSTYRDGEALGDEATADALEAAYQRYINDTYWMMAPAKLFDAGVNRSVAADSASADYDVLHLTFGDVGLTPDDRYWLYISTETDRVERWAFILQNNPDADPSFFTWTDYVTLAAPGGDIHIAQRKASEAEGGPAILTDNVDVVTTFTSADFEAPEPRL
ncbi:MAG: hypothetical protein GVY12_01795 [Bacteroidetes bacterium]|jgi:hypothetical protein|nr:hypothetical protein [Bacteroidota bacterium]